MTESVSPTKREPLTEFENLQKRMRSLLTRWGNGGSALATNGEFGDWTPAVDVAEDDMEYTISADTPDVAKDQVHVTIDDGVLVISGERTHQTEEKKKRYHRVERSYGKAFRVDAEPNGENLHVQEIESSPDLNSSDSSRLIGSWAGERSGVGSLAMGDVCFSVPSELGSMADRMGTLVDSESAESWHLVAPPQMFWDLWDILDPQTRTGLERMDRSDLTELLHRAVPPISLPGGDGLGLLALAGSSRDGASLG